MRIMNAIIIPIIVILFGIWLLFRHLLPINISFFRLLAGIVVILVGINLIAGAFQNNYSKGSAGINNAQTVGDELRYDTVFGQNNIDIDKNMLAGKNIKLDCVFGSLVLKLPKDEAYRFETNCAFGNIRLPDGQSVSFGDMVFQKGENIDTPHKVKISCVFGSVKVEYY